MLHFNLEKPVRLVWFGEFISPEHDWKHLTRTLYEYEMMIVTEGELFIADEREEYHVKAGEYLIMPPTPFQHGTRVCKCRFYWLHFHCLALPPSVFLPKTGSFSDEKEIHRIAGKLLQAEMRDHRGVNSDYLATELLLELCAGQQDKRDENLSPQADICRKIKSYVEWHRFSDIRIADVAKELGYHEKYLSSVFSKSEGVTLKAYIIEQRVKEAKRLLLETDYTVAEVAYYLNFESPHNFSRYFKAATGLTPLAFREKEKNSTQ